MLTALAVLAVIALGLVAGRWQWGRYETKSHALAAQDRAQSLAPAPLGALLTPGEDAGDVQWRVATASGTLDAGSLTEVRGRSVDDTPSLQYVAWLRVDDGTSVLVNLGWTPRAQAVAPDLPDGPVTVEGVLRSLEPDNGKPGTRISPAQVPGGGRGAIDAYLMATSACGTAGCVEGLEPVPSPDLSLGPHLSYALQWWLLALAAAPIGVVVTRRDAALERERWEAEASGEGGTGGTSELAEAAAPAGRAPTAAATGGESAPARRRRGSLWGRHDGPSDEDIEDAL